jgi:dTMP kinase
MKNLFITFEGIEGCGKSTQASLLANYFISMGFEVVLSREPGGPPISERIREILLDNKHTDMTAVTELLLYLAARHQHMSELILPSLKEGKNVICDRFTDSTFAYQGVARRLDLQKIAELNSFATDGISPDITFILDIPVDVSKKRLSAKKHDRLESEPEEFHQNVRQAFLSLAGENGRYIIIDGNKDIQAIHKEIVNIVSGENCEEKHDEIYKIK